ncbi:hypothetical protein [Corticicoccus populi]|uniref:Transposase n=1 Tax=Corticicoccus populi TaxID=1812821 RepID=A0ABW5WRS6_9STAP
MNKERNNKVRTALKEYLLLYDEPSLKVISKKAGLNYNRLTRWMNHKEEYADKSLRLIINYIKRTESKQKQLRVIIKKVS